MYSLVIIFGMASLLLGLFGAAAFIAIPRVRRRVPPPRFAEEFIDELSRLETPQDECRLVGDTRTEATGAEATRVQINTEDATPQGAKLVDETPQKEAYALHQRGEPAFRIASTMGIARADAELLIRIEESLEKNSRE
jgi:hypothetical protein